VVPVRAILTASTPSGTRFNILDLPSYPDLKSAFQNVKELSLDETLLSWLEVPSPSLSIPLLNLYSLTYTHQICTLCTHFPALTTLSASSNNLTHTASPLPTPHLTTLTLDSNSFTSLSVLSPLSTLPTLSTLSLKLNSIIYIHDPETPPSSFSFPHTTTLTLSRNAIPTFYFLSSLPAVFPSLTSLLTSHNPLYDSYSIETAHMLTLARLPPSVTTLNYSSITPQERENAELYYLGLIGKEIAAVSEADEKEVLARHPRYDELVALYGAPVIKREGGGELSKLKPGALGHRLIDFTFYVRSATDVEPEAELQMKIPKTYDTYRLKGAVYRLFRDRSSPSPTHSPNIQLKPMQFKLIWETGEWDPIFEGSEIDITAEAEDAGRKGLEANKRKGKWIKRETELIDSTRAVGFWFDDGAREVRVRVEPFRV
jgi:tubulin-specific chaperone E